MLGTCTQWYILLTVERVPAGTGTSDHWHVAALQYDGKVMAFYVDGAREPAGPLQFAPIGAGRTSIGVRQNLAYWFKGRIRLVRIMPDAVPEDRLLAVPRTPRTRTERTHRSSGTGLRTPDP